MDTEESKHELSPQLAGAPELAVDGSAVPSAGGVADSSFGGPVGGSIDESRTSSDRCRVEELEDLIGALEDARAALELARGDLSMVDWRVEDVQRELRDEYEASEQLRGATRHAAWAVSQADSAVEDLVAVVDARIGVRREQLGDSSLLSGDALAGASSPKVDEEGGATHE